LAGSVELLWASLRAFAAIVELAIDFKAQMQKYKAKGEEKAKEEKRGRCSAGMGEV